MHCVNLKPIWYILSMQDQHFENKCVFSIVKRTWALRLFISTLNFKKLQIMEFDYFYFETFNNSFHDLLKVIIYNNN